VGDVVVDQTKEGNDPSKKQKDEHQAQATKPGQSSDGEHPAKQPDPQKSPSKSTGIEKEGPGTKSGEGEDHGVQKDTGAGPFMKQ
jgi:hypothetical protein